MKSQRCDNTAEWRDQVLLATENLEVSVGKQILPVQVSQINFTLSVVCCSEYAVVNTL